MTHTDSPTVKAAADSACWNEKGTYGRGSCKELAQHVHCRNCPVYSEAAVQLLDRPMPADYRRHLAEHLAREKKLREVGHTSAIMFRIGREWLALPTRVFEQVAERRTIHSLPHRRSGSILGLVNISGELVICISLGHLLRIAATNDPKGGHRLLVVYWQAVRVAFPVEEIQGPERFHPRDLKSLSATLSRCDPVYTRNLVRWRDGAAGLLDADLVFSTVERNLA